MASSARTDDMGAAQSSKQRYQDLGKTKTQWEKSVHFVCVQFFNFPQKWHCFLWMYQTEFDNSRKLKKLSLNSPYEIF